MATPSGKTAKKTLSAKSAATSAANKSSAATTSSGLTPSGNTAKKLNSATIAANSTKAKADTAAIKSPYAWVYNKGVNLGGYTPEEAEKALSSGLKLNQTYGYYTDADGYLVDPSTGKQIQGVDKSSFETSGGTSSYKESVVQAGGVQTQAPAATVEAPVDATEALADTTAKATESYQEAFKTIMNALGDQAENFRKQYLALSKDGQSVDIASPQFQEEIRKAQEQGTTDYTPILKKYLKSDDAITAGVLSQQTKLLANQAVQAGLDGGMAKQAINAFKNGYLNEQQLSEYFSKQIGKLQGSADGTGQEDASYSPSSGYATDVNDDISPTDQVSQALTNISSANSSSIMSMLSGAGVDTSNMSSAELLQVLIAQQTLDYADDPTTQTYLDTLTASATSAFNSAMKLYGEGGTAVKEINKAISGTDFTPSTYEGLMAKVYAQTKDTSLDYIENEKNYLQEEYDVWYSQELDKRGRLEGYLKAKLYAAGAQDSTSGLALMALSVNAADLNLQLGRAEYRYSQSKLNIQAQEALNNYANQISELTFKVKDSKDAAVTEYDNKLMEITKMQIENDKEKQKLKLDALSTFADKMYQIEQDKQEQYRWTYEQSQKEIDRAIDVAYKTSGLTGSVWAIDEDGKVYDTGVQTFDAQKWQKSYWLDAAKFQHDVSNDTYNQILGLVDRGGDWKSFAEANGFDTSQLGNLKSKEEISAYFENLYSGNSYFQGLFSDNKANQNLAATNYYNSTGGGVKTQGVAGLDEMGYEDVFDSVNQFAKTITQSESTPVNYLGAYGMSTHGGYDLIYNGKYAQALTDGVVTEIIPAEKSGGWGGIVRVMDSQGRVHQYAHIGMKDYVGASQFNVQVGDTIEKGQALGVMGNSGNTYGKTGIHTDYRIVGFIPQEQAAKTAQANEWVDFIAQGGLGDLSKEESAVLTAASGTEYQSTVMESILQAKGGPDVSGLISAVQSGKSSSIDQYVQQLSDYASQAKISMTGEGDKAGLLQKKVIESVNSVIAQGDRDKTKEYIKKLKKAFPQYEDKIDELTY